ncbi:MAG: transporter substrate-binding domain-containing protein [Fibrobacterales bacterium]
MKPLLLFWIFFATHSTAQNRDTLVFNTIEGDLPIVKMGEELVSYIYDLLGYEIVVKRLPAKRALQESNEGMVDGELGRVEMIMNNYPNLVKIDEPLTLIAISVFTRKNETRFCNLDSFSQSNVGIARGLVTIEDMTIGMKRSITNSIVSALGMLVHKRVDTVIFLQLEGYMLLKQLQYESSIFVCPEPIKRFKAYHYLHKKHEHLIKRFNQKVAELKKNGIWQRLMTDIEKRYYGKIVAEMNRHYGGPYSIHHMFSEQ